MADGNTLAGVEKMKRPSIRVHEDDLEAFDEWVENSEYADRTKALRGLMREAANGRPSSDLMPLVPPSEERLAVAYRKLCQAAYPNGIVQPSTAERVAANGPENLSKQEVLPLVLRPLDERGYLNQLTDPVYGRTAWRIVGWED